MEAETSEPPPAPPVNTENTDTSASTAVPAPSEPAPEPKLSKNALKRIRKQQEWEDGREDHRKRRKEKRVERRIRKREEKATLRSQGHEPPRKGPSTLVPISIILDCGFEEYMTDKERISLSSQVVRCYSMNRTALWKTHVVVGGFKGNLKERFTGPMLNMHENWKNIQFCEGGIEECVEKAGQMMKSKGGQMIPALEKTSPANGDDEGTKDDSNTKSDFDAEPPPAEGYENVVYLTSDSPNTLQRLEANTSYIIGGIVDKNREKEICYRRAREKNIRTAKLPIREFMQLQARHILATNHVVEIMLKWLEYEDWGKAFVDVIPKRKGGTLKSDAEAGNSENMDEEEEEDDDDEHLEALENPNLEDIGDGNAVDAVAQSDGAQSSSVV